MKDLIESFGIPHTEVDCILINGQPAGFDWIVGDGDRIAVHPVFRITGIREASALRGPGLDAIRFVLDVHLGTLARRLRLLGFDTDYSPERDDPELADISSAAERILLTRDRRLLMRRKVRWGVVVRNSDPFLQTVEILDRLGIWDDIEVFSRCISCNGRLYQVAEASKEQRLILSQLPDGVTCWCQEFVRCDSCRKIYWQGSHFDKMKALLAELHRSRQYIRTGGNWSG